jgi:SWIM zinc finger
VVRVQSGVCIDTVMDCARLREPTSGNETGRRVSFTISADDPRSIRALELAAEADQWLRGRNRQGEEVFGVPSQSDPGHYYIVTRSSCDCPDFRHSAAPGPGPGQPSEQRPCKHILAVRLHTELVRAQQHQARPAAAPRRRDHLSVVPRPEAGSTTSS